LIVGALLCLIPGAGLAITPYSQDFESLDQLSLTALGDDGWVVYGNVFDSGGGFLYGYGTFPAPNDASAFCGIELLQGGVEQGIQQLVVTNDYNNVDHANGFLIESNVFREQTIEAGDVFQTWEFSFQAKLGNLVAPSTAVAFIKTVDPANGFATTNFITQDMTNTPVTWDGYTLSITIDPGLVGSFLQIGFASTATLYQSAGIFYDNIVFERIIVSDVPDVSTITGASLGQNYPNPFNPKTRIDFSLDRSQNVDISVFDIAGRRIATLRQGELGAGDHHVTWNGQTDRGTPAPAGRYSYVLSTADGKVSRSMVLLK
jgi:hypothetical protein